MPDELGAIVGAWTISANAFFISYAPKAAAAQKIQDDARGGGAAAAVAPMTNGGRKMSTGLVPSLNRLRIQQCFKAAR
ncbi:hypothetical protein ANCDUO_07404 [Ancylostoma duodenale]|uniref:Uncharacterized protein n=1 Tax=Ancylostoma duodenale TaxID=51022 RepID=A0A0C2GTI9_9BILA|nr:hypothetical protein ANCDUO_07404 [Ancylostoma duodenale]